MSFVLRRLRGRLATAGAALLTIVLTAAVLAALTAFERGVGDAGVRRALTGQDRALAAVQVTGSTDLAGRAHAEAAVHQLGVDLFGPLPASAQEFVHSGSYLLPATGATGVDGKPVIPDVTSLATVAQAQIRVTAGRLPAPSDGTHLEVAVPDVVVRQLGLHPDALPATVRLTGQATLAAVDVTVTGIYRAADPTDPYWQLDGLGGQDARVFGGYTLYGPMLVDESAFTGKVVPQSDISWLITPDFGRLSAADIEDLRLRTLDPTSYLDPNDGLQADTRLPEALAELRTDLLVARSTLAIGALQLTVLAAAALTLVTRLLGERQETETAMLVARGASRGRIAALSAAEAAVLTLPAALLAPLLTPLLLRLLASYGPLAHAGVRLDGGLPVTSWVVAALVAVAAAIAVVTPVALRGGATAVLRRAGRGRAATAGMARSGADLAVVLLAVLAYQQLAHYSSGTEGGGALSADAHGQLAVDPVLVAAPTLALAAGTVIVLRLLPPVARLGERLAARGRGLAGVLAGWQFARRPGRHAGPVLLLVLAVSMGMLALGQGASWDASQRDQAAFATAGGLRITDTGLPPAGQGGLISSVPGSERALPVERELVALRSGAAAQLIALDSRQAARWLSIGPQLRSGRSTAKLFGSLAAPAPTGPQAGLPLPGRPVRIDLDLSVRITDRPPLPSRLPSGATPPDGPSAHHPALTLQLRDRFGVIYRVQAAELPEDGDAVVPVDLASLTGAPTRSMASPVTLVGMELSYAMSLHGGVSQTLTIHRILGADSPHGPATALTVPDGLSWDAQTTTNDVRRGTDDLLGQKTDATVHPVNGQAVLTADYRTGVGWETSTATITAADRNGSTAPVPQGIDVVATDGLLAAAGASVGDRIPVSLGSQSVLARVVASVPALPTTTDNSADSADSGSGGGSGGSDSGAPMGLAADLGTIDRVLLDRHQAQLEPTEWWLPGTGPDDPVPGRAAAALRSENAPGRFQVEQELTDALRSDPLGAAPQDALLAIAAVAALRAAVGFAAAMAGAAGERVGEFAVLRALGAPQRQLARTVAAEQGVLIALGLGVGTAVGALLARLLVPLVTLTPQARRPSPAVALHLPLGQVALLILAVAALPALQITWSLLRPARRSDTAARLRHSEET